MSHKIIISKPTFEVFDEIPDNLIYSSEFDTLKYDTQGLKTVSVNLANYYHSTPATPPFIPASYYNYAIGEISHNLGYVPHFAGYILDFPYNNYAIQAPFSFGDFIFFMYLSVYADENKLYFVVHYNTTENTGTEDFEFAYRIFKNDLDF